MMRIMDDEYVIVVIWFEIGKSAWQFESKDNINYPEKKVEIEFNKTLGKCKFHWNSAKVVNFMFLPTFARKLINWLEGIILVRILFVLRLKGPHTALHRKHWGSRRENGTEGKVANLRINDISYQFRHVNVNVLHKHTFEAFYKSSTFK